MRRWRMHKDITSKIDQKLVMEAANHPIPGCVERARPIDAGGEQGKQLCSIYGQTEYVSNMYRGIDQTVSTHMRKAKEQTQR